MRLMRANHCAELVPCENYAVYSHTQVSSLPGAVRAAAAAATAAIERCVAFTGGSSLVGGLTNCAVSHTAHEVHLEGPQRPGTGSSCGGGALRPRMHTLHTSAYVFPCWHASGFIHNGC
jgi:hypothetical protein